MKIKMDIGKTNFEAIVMESDKKAILIFILVSYETYDAYMWLRVFLLQNV